MSKTMFRLSALALFAAAAAACGAGEGGSADRRPGQTDFTTEEQGRFGDYRARAGGPSAAGGADSASATPAPRAPAGRTGQVEEGDIYRVAGNRLFYLNTYRGFVIFDVTNPKQPQRLARLPVHGYPIEMFVEGNTVYALLRDALYLTQKNGALEFERHNVSQLVTIDITDVSNPRVLKTFDIVGELREGVSRKIDSTIYVVSYQSRDYWWGWREPGARERKDQAWVYSFDVSQPAAPRQVQALQVFEGGSVNINDAKSGSHYSRNFESVAISATANALMVVENWRAHGYSNTRSQCGSSTDEQQAIVSIIDISDPKGTIRKHTRFETDGGLNDQFKMTYVVDEATAKATFFGIFARQGWFSSGCTGRSFVRNTLESWDVSNGATPRRLQALDFGKPEETVHASTFDVERKVVYAITARRTDPLYAISIENPAAMRVLSAVEGLSGNMTVFRSIGDRQFLIGIGQDQSDTCTGFDDAATPGWRPSKIAVSVIDVRDLARVRLVQRKCVAVENAEWIGSQLTWNMDQAHKMIGMHSDGTANVITVPVYYARRVGDEWWGHRSETAVGMMSWDLTRYDDRKSEREQTVLENYGTFVHPEGEVRRSFVFTHQTTQQRMMINLSDTHVSIANLADLRRPQLEAVVELAPYHNQVYRFGDHIVEQVQSRQTHHWGGNTELSHFRVKVAGGDLEDQAPVASFSVGGVNRTYKHGNLLVLLRTAQVGSGRTGAGGIEAATTSEALIYDLSTPAAPKRLARVGMPALEYPYHEFRCGVGSGYGHWFGGSGSSFAETASGLVFLRHAWYGGTDAQTGLVFLDLRTPGEPKVSAVKVAGDDRTDAYGLVSDPSAPEGFYLWHRKHVGQRKAADGAVFSLYRDFAQRWELRGSWAQAHEVNIPGQLVRTWKKGNERLLLTQDHSYRVVRRGTNSEWHADTRLALLRQTEADGRPAAELRDARLFPDLAVSALVIDGDRLFVNAQSQHWGWDQDDQPAPTWQETADRLMIFDLAATSLRAVYDRPMKAYGTQLMGVHQGKLFLNLTGDGILIVDVTDPAAPAGVHFLRTLGWASHIEFAGDDVYVAAGHFGLFHTKLSAAPTLALE